MKARLFFLVIAFVSLPFAASATYYCPGPDCPNGTVEDFSIEFTDLNYKVDLCNPWVQKIDFASEVDGKILTAELEFYVIDDGDRSGEWIQAMADIQPLLGLFGDWAYLNGEPTEYQGLKIAPLMFADGKLCVSILGNDFILQEVELEGTYCAPVPEPATMMLFGLGLFGLGGYLRRRQA